MLHNNKIKKNKNQSRFVLGVDLDGVVADFYKGLRPIAAEWFGIKLDDLPIKFQYGLQEWGIKTHKEYDDLHRFAVTQRNLFKELDPIKGAPACLRRISNKNIRIRIITHRLFIKYFHEEAVSQTIKWLDNYGIPYWDLCFVKDKAAVGADMYIEDAPDNIKTLREDGHYTVVFVNSTNKHLEGPKAKTWKEAEKLILKKFVEWDVKKRIKNLDGK